MAEIEGVGPPPLQSIYRLRDYLLIRSEFHLFVLPTKLGIEVWSRKLKDTFRNGLAHSKALQCHCIQISCSPRLKALATTVLYVSAVADHPPNHVIANPLDDAHTLACSRVVPSNIRRTFYRSFEHPPDYLDKEHDLNYSVRQHSASLHIDWICIQVHFRQSYP